MKTRWTFRASLGALALLGLVQGGASVMAASSNTITIPFAAAHFQTPKSNAYFPLKPGTTYTFRGVSKLGVELNTVDITNKTKTILGVAATVVHDVVRIEDGSISEDTLDWFAADNDGNVWYFGEDTKEFDHGTLLTTEGSWEAGKNGAAPGIIFLSNPHVGDQYQQENSPGIVADVARIISLDETVTVEYGTFTHCIETTEFTPIEPGSRSHKFYAPGFGTVLEISTKQGGERVELISVK